VNMTQQFLSTALPVMVTFAVAAWFQGRGLDGINHRIDDVIARLGRIEAKLDNHADRIARLEERTSMVVRG
jgi:Ser/Thr protein kinase RdoA (MazF antagonist)